MLASAGFVGSVIKTRSKSAAEPQLKIFTSLAIKRNNDETSVISIDMTGDTQVGNSDIL